MKLAISVTGLAARMAAARAGRLRDRAVAAARAELAHRGQLQQAVMQQTGSSPPADAPTQPTPPRS